MAFANAPNNFMFPLQIKLLQESKLLTEITMQKIEDSKINWPVKKNT